MIEILYSQRQREDGYKYWVQGVIIEEGVNALPFQASVDTAAGTLCFAFSSDCSDSQRTRTVRHYGEIVKATQVLTARERLSELKPRLDAVKQKVAETQPMPSTRDRTHLGPVFAGVISKANKDATGTYWVIEGGLFAFVKNMGKWSSGRSVTLEKDQCGFVIAEYNVTGYAGLFRPLTPENVAEIAQAKKSRRRHSIKPLRVIGMLRKIHDGHSPEFIREFLMMPAHEPNSVDDVWVAAQEHDPSTPLGRYRYIKVAA